MVPCSLLLGQVSVSEFHSACEGWKISCFSDLLIFLWFLRSSVLWKTQIEFILQVAELGNQGHSWILDWCYYLFQMGWGRATLKCMFVMSWYFYTFFFFLFSFWIWVCLELHLFIREIKLLWRSNVPQIHAS